MNRPQHTLEPAFSLINRLGGSVKVIERLNVKPSVVYRFMTPRELGGRGGTIPERYHGQLTEFAAELGIEAEIADRLAKMRGSKPRGPVAPKAVALLASASA